MVPVKLFLFLLFVFSSVLADERIGEIAEKASFYSASPKTGRSQIPRVAQQVHRIPRPMPRPVLVKNIEPVPQLTVQEVPNPETYEPVPLIREEPYSRPNFTFSRPVLGWRPVTYSSTQQPPNVASSYVPYRPTLSLPSRQPGYSIPTTPAANIVEQDQINEQQENLVPPPALSTPTYYRPILSARPIPRPSTIGVIAPQAVESRPPVILESPTIVEDEPSNISPVPSPEYVVSEINNEKIVNEQKEVVFTPRPLPTPSESKLYYQRPFISARPMPRPISHISILVPTTEQSGLTESSTLQAIPVTEPIPNMTSLPEQSNRPQEFFVENEHKMSKPAQNAPIITASVAAQRSPYQRPAPSARPIPRPIFNGIMNTPQPMTLETNSIPLVTSPSLSPVEPEPTEAVDLPIPQPKPIEPLPNPTFSPSTTYLPVETWGPVTPKPEVIPEMEPVWSENVPISDASPEIPASRKPPVIVPKPMPSRATVSLSNPRPNDEYWKPIPIPSVSSDSIIIKRPPMPSPPRYPQVGPDNSVSDANPQSKPSFVTKPRPSKQPHADSLTSEGNILEIRCERENGYFPRQECERYVECKRNVAIEYQCPDGLQFNTNAIWPEYPCAYPSEVQCNGRTTLQQAYPTSECPRQYGYFSMGGDCTKYIMCQQGLASIMSCPPGLVFNTDVSGCDWPEKVPSCSPEVFQGFTCPQAPLDEDGLLSDVIINYKYGNSCKNYVACQRGSPRLLSCDEGFSFDMISGYCIESDYVENCANFT